MVSCGLMSVGEWVTVNAEFGARRPARESREASTALGRRFLQLAAAMSKLPVLEAACKKAGSEIHLAASFAFVAGALGRPRSP